MSEIEFVEFEWDLDAWLAAGEELFGERFSMAQEYGRQLATTGVEWGLIGPREVPRLWERHILNCGVVSDLISQDASVIDIGSGAGLPGLVLSIARPDISMTLIEPLKRRCEWLEMVSHDLGVEVEVLRGRADEFHVKRSADIVTSRAVAPLGKLVTWSAPLIEQGGTLLAMKGASAQREIESSSTTLRKVGLTDVVVKHCGAEHLEVPTTVVSAQKVKPAKAVHKARGRKKKGRRSGR